MKLYMALYAKVWIALIESLLAMTILGVHMDTYWGGWISDNNNLAKFLPKKHTFIYILGILLVFTAAYIWIFFKLFYISWVLAAIFIGIKRPLGRYIGRHIRPTLWSIAWNLVAGFVYAWILFVLDMSWWCLWSCHQPAPPGVLFVLDMSWWVKYIFLYILFLMVTIPTNSALQYDIEQDMCRRSSQATRIMEQALSTRGGKIPKFGLYLRPFVTTDHLPAATFPKQLFSDGDAVSYVDMETIFKRAFYQELDLITLGRPEDIREGIARVTVHNEGWQHVVRQLADNATLIMVVPFSHEGTLWELRKLKSKGHIGKTVFLMPETLSEQPDGVIVPGEKNNQAWGGTVFFDPAAHFLDIAAEWKKAREILNEEGIVLPPYARCGALFTLNPDTGQVKQIAPLFLSLLIQRKKYLLTVLTEFGLIPWRAKSNTDLLNAFEASTFPTRKNREYVLTFALELFATLGETETASTILQRIHNIVRDQPLMIDQILAEITVICTDPYQYEILKHSDDMKSYLNALRKVNGINTVLVEEACKALDEGLEFIKPTKSGSSS